MLSNELTTLTDLCRNFEYIPLMIKELILTIHPLFLKQKTKLIKEKMILYTPDMTKLMSEGTVVNRKLNSIDSAIPINRYSDSILYIGRFHSKDSTIYLKLGLSLKTFLT